ncbi:MAG: serine/threonine-protein phosphatase [Lachnospiraceae bacterium]|nr:serine/threonine-protein phosphatase [Lachnospiraceae bacterium]
MQLKKRRSLYTLIIISIIVTLILFGSIIVVIGYYGFTKNYSREFNSLAYKSAKTATRIVEEDGIERYLKYSADELKSEYDDIQKNAGEGTYNDESESFYDAVYYYSAYSSLSDLCNTMDMAVIYAIVPSKDYKEFTCVFNCLNENSPYDEWELGHVVKSSSKEYEAAFKNIMENNSDKEIVGRYSNLNGGKAHITALVPIKSDDGKIEGIMCAQRYVAELESARRSFVQGVGALTVVLIIIIILNTSFFLHREIIAPVNSVVAEADRFARENTKSDEVLDMNAYRVREIQSLAKSLDTMEDEIIKNIENITEITKNNERIGTEIELAKRIQVGMLPEIDEEFSEEEMDAKEFDIFALMKPAKEVGGDFYDFFKVDDTHIALIIADVSDKGIGAAFFMAITKTLIRARAKLGGSAIEVVNYADKLISAKNDVGMFATVWLGIVDMETGHVDVCNCGHDYPAIMKSGEDFVIEKTPHGPPIAFIPGAEFKSISFDLEPGDRIFLYTDGLNEALSKSGKRFGIDRILDVLNSNKELDDEAMIGKMREEVIAFADGEPQFDDMTMLGFTFLKKNN